MSIRQQTIYAVGTEYATVGVSAKVDGAWVDLSSKTVALAFKTSGTPTSGDWHAATWDTDTSTDPTTYIAQTLVGAGGLALAAGHYSKWVKVTDLPEIVVMPAGTLVVK